MSDQSATAIELTFASLPEGWKGTPQEFLEWMSENATLYATGASLAGQIGGSRPITNVGIYVNGRTIELWDAGKSKYLPQLTVPIGSVFDWPSAIGTPPDNYLFCEGQQLNIADYPDLAAIIGTTFNKAADSDSTKFRMPNYLGRASVGAGDSPGEYDPRGDASGYPTTGPMISRAPGDYWGSEWPQYRIPVPANAPTPRYSHPMNGTGDTHPPYVWNKSFFNSIVPPSIGVRKIMRAV
jgi:hypothetical protein